MKQFTKMDLSTIILEISAVTLIAAIGIAVIAVNRMRKGELNEKTSELQFGKRKYIPPNGYVDTNIAKTGKTMTLSSIFSEGSMRWDDFFNPKNEEQIELRSKASYMLLGFYLIAGLITLTMAYLDLTWGYYFGLLAMAYATLIVCVNYVKARRK